LHRFPKRTVSAEPIFTIFGGGAKDRDFSKRESARLSLRRLRLLGVVEWNLWSITALLPSEADDDCLDATTPGKSCGDG
jgi:hypothetical protein